MMTSKEADRLLYRNFPSWDGYTEGAVRLLKGLIACAVEGQEPRRCGWKVMFGRTVPADVRRCLFELARLRHPRGEDLVEAEEPRKDDTDEMRRGQWTLRAPDTGESGVEYVRALRLRLGAPVSFRGSGYPYYILIVADPQEISWEFQIQLELQNSVGRLWLGNDRDAYEPYVDSVIHAENSPAVGCEASFFSVPPTDPFVTSAYDQLFDPLFQSLKEDSSPGNKGTTGPPEPLPAGPFQALHDLLNSQSQASAPTPTPRHRWLLTLSHGYEISTPGGQEDGPDCTRQDYDAWQGALALSQRDASNPAARKNGRLFAGPSPDVGSLAATGIYSMACHSAGTRQFNPISKALKREEVQQAPADLISICARKWLTHPAGPARCFVGHVDRLSSVVFLDPNIDEQTNQYHSYGTHYELFCRSICKGDRVGWAKEEAFRTLLMATLFAMEDKRRRGGEGMAEEFRIYSDLSSIVIHGDPAVKLA